ncbi:MAG: serine protease [Candidatus Woesebacteria bacterium GW2011_GWB1_39_10]|uniref:Serine protease n=2 Tax=Candidatus Woeseibacteriota TaxID=1752722 RepID=A0A0G0PSA7_9BACT|nr:MAG: serine protease [Candidatus Woesebacteria bacterium GW2011_GWB1_39_10]KKS91191.1 MAG: serine protease [Candidatus Woesebacteria bacterium GW2011_GWA1_43_12]
MGIFVDSIKKRFKKITSSIEIYFKKLLFPVYLVPLKLLTYPVYYLLKFAIRLLLAILGLIIDCVVYPFKSLKNFLKSLIIVIVSLYLVASLFVISDYLTKQYGWWGKFLCAIGTKGKLQNSVVRVVGGYSEGSGFFIDNNQILTNFHVIADEPSPKIILPDGKLLTPIKILGDNEADLAVLFVDSEYPNMVLPLPDKIGFYEEEPLVSVGYPLGTDLSGKATVMRGNFVDFRRPKTSPIGYIQTNISLVQGMSGGPIADQCGQVVGINTISLAGLSLFITGSDAKTLVPKMTDQEIKKIEVDPSLSPEEAVRAYYTYLKARRMKDGFDLLSQEYLQKTNFEEWTNRFRDILDVDVIKSERFENTTDTAFVKFSTKNWVDGEAELHYYEGTWKTVKEDGVYKMLRSKIKEVENPEWGWFYE